MKPTLHWSEQAREDQFDIFLTIAQDNSDAAERVYNAIEDRAETLISLPHIGVRRPDIDPSARVLIEGPYLILYKLIPRCAYGVCG
jgi:toxin ParE1/3/4